MQKKYNIAETTMLKVQRLQQNENEIKSINNLTTTGYS
jgi:hypothetical protein